MAENLEESTRAFLLGQIDRLEPFDFVQICPGATQPTIEVLRDEQGHLRLSVPAEPSAPLPLTRRAHMAEAGWRSADPNDPAMPWQRSADTASSALDMASDALRLGWASGLGERPDVLHGNRRAEHEAVLALARLRARLEPLLTDITGFAPEIDSDGDYRLAVEGVRVLVAVRAAPAAPVVVRVCSLTNIGVTIGPELGLFLSRVNLGLTFARFALDTDHQAVWFEETLLGSALSDEEARFMVGWIARGAGEWAPRLQHMFGGITQRELDSGRLSELKPKSWRSGG